MKFGRRISIGSWLLLSLFRLLAARLLRKDKIHRFPQKLSFIGLFECTLIRHGFLKKVRILITEYWKSCFFVRFFWWVWLAFAFSWRWVSLLLLHLMNFLDTYDKVVFIARSRSRTMFFFELNFLGAFTFTLTVLFEFKHQLCTKSLFFVFWHWDYLVLWNFSGWQFGMSVVLLKQWRL